MVEEALQTAHRHLLSGKLVDAETLCSDFIEHNPRSDAAYYLQGLIAHRAGDLHKAVESMKRAATLAPSKALIQNSLGIILGAIGDSGPAEAAFRKAIALRPDCLEAHCNLGVALSRQERWTDAEAALRRSLQGNPRFVEALVNLGHVLRQEGKLEEALAHYQRAVAINPAAKEAYAGLATLMRNFGHAEEAVAFARRAVELSPTDAVAHSNLLYSLHYLPSFSSEQLFEAHLGWARQHAAAKPEAGARAHDRTPTRLINIGYISADFREHPRARFIEPLLAHYDQTQFKVFCYSDCARTDATTDRLRRLPVTWWQIVGLNDQSAADLIRNDQIDILVDCTGHMARNRMLLLARKPAPIQVLYPGYPNTSGLKAIDYWITDRFQDPPGLTEQFYTEHLIRLSAFARCYTPAAEDPPPTELPAAINRHITFGALNNPLKHNPGVLKLWAKVMAALPTARMVMIAARGAEGMVRRSAERYGIPRDRLEIAARDTRSKYLALWGKVDIALDPFPYNGYTTTLDALWMGIPVVALAGQSSVSRAGLSILSNVNLPELIANSMDEYVEIVMRLSSNVHELGQLRSQLRERLRVSPIMDIRRFMGEIENAYRAMWHDWRKTSATA